MYLSGGEIPYRKSNPFQTGRLAEVRTSSQCSREIIAVLHLACSVASKAARWPSISKSRLPAGSEVSITGS
jgi:hypothetical protein